MNITKNFETKQPIIDSLLSIPGLLRASDLELKPRREAPMASANSPVCGHPKLPQARTLDYDGSVLMASRLAASLSL